MIVGSLAGLCAKGEGKNQEGLQMYFWRERKYETALQKQ